MVLVADFTQYWVHRTFHTVPWLWRFHAIHHSAEEMDWLAGSRLHLVDVIVYTRSDVRADLRARLLEPVRADPCRTESPGHRTHVAL